MEIDLAEGLMESLRLDEQLEEGQDSSTGAWQNARESGEPVPLRLIDGPASRDGGDLDLPPRCGDLVRQLRTHMNYHWITSDSGELWELRALFQTHLQNLHYFCIGITLFANHEGDARKQQYAVYLELVFSSGKLRLRWASQVEQSMAQIKMTLGAIYSIENLVADILEGVAPHSVLVEIPVDPLKVEQALSG